MKGFLLSTIVWVLLLVSYQSLQSDNRLVLFLKNAPEEAIQGAMADAVQQQNIILDKLAVMDQQTPSYNSIKNIKNALRSQLMQSLSGFLAIYSGYMSYTDNQGQVSFPLRHANPKVYIVITPNVNLVKIKGQTISHREFINDEKNPAKFYVCERKEEVIQQPGQPTPSPAPQGFGLLGGEQVDPLTGLPLGTGPQQPQKRYYWHIQELKVPDDKKINPLSVVILTKPKNIYVPIGKFLAVPSPHLVLPNFYVIGNINNNETLLRAIEYGNYFEKITTEEKKANENTYQKMITNI